MAASSSIIGINVFLSQKNWNNFWFVSEITTVLTLASNRGKRDSDLLTHHVVS
jgi:hypothetical protein